MFVRLNIDVNVNSFSLVLSTRSTFGFVCSYGQDIKIFLCLLHCSGTCKSIQHSTLCSGMVFLQVHDIFHCFIALKLFWNFIIDTVPQQAMFMQGKEGQRFIGFPRLSKLYLENPHPLVSNFDP